MLNRSTVQHGVSWDRQVGNPRLAPWHATVAIPGHPYLPRSRSSRRFPGSLIP